jgi:microcystin-dependent protein
MAYATRRSYAGAAPACTLTNNITSVDDSFSVTGDVTNWTTTASGPFYAVIDPGLATEEKILVATRSTTLLSSVTRGVDGTVAAGHNAGAVCYPVFTAVDADQANKVASTLSTKGDLLVTDGSALNRLPVNATDGYTLLTSAAATNGVVWGQVANAGVATGAAIDKTKIAGTAVTLADTGTVTSTMIANTTIVQGDIALTLLKLLCPVGTIAASVATTAPIGWILCNGTAVSAGTYPELNALCATTPDLRGRTVIGVGTGTGLTARALNATGGTETHALTEAELATHTHANGLTNSTVTTNSITSTSHSHGINDSNTYWGENGTVDWTLANGSNISFKRYNDFDRTSDAASVDHTHNITTSVTIQNAAIGSGTAHNNMQPFYALNYIIKHDYV